MKKYLIYIILIFLNILIFWAKISLEEKKNIILKEYNLNLKKGENMYSFFFDYRNDIKYNILDRDLEKFEEYRIIG